MIVYQLQFWPQYDFLLKDSISQYSPEIAEKVVDGLETKVAGKMSKP